MKKLSFLLAFLLCASAAFAQNITRKGDTLIATPAKTYQWLKNGTAINGATNQKYIPTEKGNYTVRLGDVSDSFLYQFNAYVNVSGLIYNKKLEGIPNATVEINGIKTTTDAKGKYQLRCPKTLRALVRVNHPDYLNRTLGFVTTEGDTLYKDVLLDHFTVTHTFDAKRSTMLGVNDFSMVMPDSAVMDVKTGKPYYGKVSVHLSAHQPGEALFGEQMPGGDFLGITKDGEENVLYSYGFFTCELKGESGEKLNLAKDKTAKVTFQVSDHQRNRMQENVPLWHFDENAGIWVEISTMTKAGNSYTAEVSHFSSWNCDWKGPVSWVEGEVIACDDTNAIGGTVYADQVPIQVDSKGYYKGWVPAQWDIDIYSSNKSKEYTVPKLQPEETHKVPTFTVNTLKGLGWIDSTGYLKIYQVGGKGIVNYSADGGNTFQPSPEFQFEASDTRTKFCVIRDERGCEKRFEAKVLKIFSQDCGLMDIDSVNYALNRFYYITDYMQNFQTMSPVFIIDSLNQFQVYQANLHLMGCLQGIRIENIEDIPSEQVWNCINSSPKLQAIRIENANLSSIPSLSCAKNLSYLYLSYTPLASLSKEVGEWKNLKGLDLSDNQLTGIPAEAGEWKKMDWLSLYNNQLTSLPKEAGEWKNLTDVNLSNNQLTSLPKEVGEWKNVRTLYLNNNQFTSLPKEVGEWTNLTTLNLSSTPLTSLPKEIGGWANLNILNLSNNQFKSLPKEIGEWKKMTDLNLSFTQLTGLPKEISGWTNLNALNLSNNQFKSLPPEVGEWKNLRVLNLSSTPLGGIPKEAGEWKNLDWLSLSSTQLTSLPKEAGEWKNLTDVNLSYNQLTSLPPEVREWKNLNDINLSYNQFKSLPPEVREWKNLTILYLSANQLTSLPPQIAELKDNLKFLYLTGNPISSEERTKIKSWLPKTTIFF